MMDKRVLDNPQLEISPHHNNHHHHHHRHNRIHNRFDFDHFPWNSSNSDPDSHWTQLLQEEHYGKTASESLLKDAAGIASAPLGFYNRELDEMHHVISNETDDGNINSNILLVNVQNDSYSTVNLTARNMKSPELEFISSLYSMVIPPMLFLCVLTALVNLIIVLSAHWCRKPMSPTLYFSISLALADAYASIILGIGLIFNSLLPIVYDWKTPMCLKLAVEAFRLGGILVILCHLLALAINHWIGIVRPLHYAATMTRRTAWIIIILSWICPILLFFTYFSTISGQGFLSEGCMNCAFMGRLEFRGLFASFFFPPLLLMTLIYIHIFFIVKQHQSQRLRYQANDQSCQQLRRNVKAVVTTVLILGTYVIGWMPATLFHIIVCEDCTITMAQFLKAPMGLRYSFGIAVNALVILKVLVDPIIYAARYPDIQFALRKMKYELLGRCFGSCLPAYMVADPLERGYSRNERSLNETRSFRMSSFGSASSTRRPFLNSTNLSPHINGRHTNNIHRQSCKSMNGHASRPKPPPLAEMDL